MQSLSIATAADLVRRGKLILYPTEAVYGLGCDPANGAAVTMLLNLKRRAADKGLILVASDQQQLTDYLAPFPLEHAAAWQSQLDNNWPGPVTFVMPAQPGLDRRLTGGRATIAVRVSAHPVVAALCQALQHPLVSTSANLSGQSAIRHPDELLQAFGDQAGAQHDLAFNPESTETNLQTGTVAGIVAGELGGARQPSRIVSLETGEQLR